LAVALMIEGAIFRLVKGLFDHGARRGFARMTGEWPGEEHPEPGMGTFDHVAFTCADFESMRARLEKLGVKYRVADVPLTRQRQIFARDPAGNGVELNFELPANS